MKTIVFSARPHDRELLDAANRDFAHTLVYEEAALGPSTTALAAGAPAVCLFVNDLADAATLARHGETA